MKQCGYFICACLLILNAYSPCIAQQDPTSLEIKRVARSSTLVAGQELECVRSVALYSKMEDAEWAIDSRSRHISKSEEDYHYENLEQVLVPKGTIVTISRILIYKGHTITRLSLEEPQVSYRLSDLARRNPGPRYSSVWTEDLEILIGKWFVRSQDR